VNTDKIAELGARYIAHRYHDEKFATKEEVVKALDSFLVKYATGSTTEEAEIDLGFLVHKAWVRAYEKYRDFIGHIVLSPFVKRNEEGKA